MAKLNVEMLRWLILGGNLLMFGLGGYVAYEFFLGARNDLREDLFDPNQYVINVEKSRNEIDALTIARILYYKPEIRPVAPPPVEVTDQPTKPGGPLDEFAYVQHIKMGRDSMAEIQVKTAQVNEPPPTNVRRRPSRSSRTTRTRSSAPRRTGRAATPGKRELWAVVEGDKFREQLIVKITEDKVVYRGVNDSQLYELERSEPEDNIEDTIQESEHGGTRLEPIADWDGEDTAQSALASADEFDKATINSKHMPDDNNATGTPTPSRTTTPIRTPSRTPTRTPPNRRTPGRANPSKEPTKEEVKALEEAMKGASAEDRKKLQEEMEKALKGGRK